MMKKMILTAFSLTASFALFCYIPTKTAFAQPDQPIVTECKSAYCMDAYTGTPVYEKEPTKRLPIASMCKIMTLLLTFDEIERGRFDYETPIPVSEHAMSMGGSQVYLQAGESYTAERLIESVIVCSANDSCVALAEYISGSDGAFVEKMNTKAKELGCDDTLFSNCTGLPKDPQYSCSHDVAHMFRALIGHKRFFDFSTMRTDDFPHPDGRTTLITNTNKLTKRYNGCDGGKTGFTNEAGFCLAATAKRGDTRVISVCIGAETSEKRFDAVSNLFDYTFANYKTEKLIAAEDRLDETCPVKGSKDKQLPAQVKEDIFVFYPIGQKPQYERNVKFFPVSAPIGKGEPVGEITVYANGKECARQSLIAVQSAERANYLDYLIETAKNW